VRIEVLLPIFNDWSSAETLLTRLNDAFQFSSDSLAVVLVDDGSTTAPPPDFGQRPHAKFESISILRLKRNLGPQRAIAVGLCHIAEKIPCDAVLIMDGDGQDLPADGARLVDKMKQLPEPTIVFAERTRRSESLQFRLGYAAYKILHVALTGQRIRVGNFSVVPAAHLERLVLEPMLWNHYAGSVFGTRIPTAMIPTVRGERIEGRSRMNLVGLVVHGLSALACYSEVIGVRLVAASGIIFLIALAAFLLLIGLRLTTDLPLPGWTSISLFLILVVILQVATLVSSVTMQIINSRSIQPFLPARDYAWFVARFETLTKT
jgi:glycosyltransferase involved in cell wall biosynthesis